MENIEKLPEEKTSGQGAERSSVELELNKDALALLGFIDKYMEKYKTHPNDVIYHLCEELVEVLRKEEETEKGVTNKVISRLTDNIKERGISLQKRKFEARMKD